jgi:competence ComEA-like helix-hairpin-helix protein
MIRTRQNRIQSFAFVIGVFLAVCFSLGFVLNPGRYESDFGRCDITLDSRLNPNNAPIESLVRLPGLGIGRAGAIVAYRESFSEKNSGSRAFHDYNDLQKVKGIGPKTVQNIGEWLKFD